MTKLSRKSEQDLGNLIVKYEQIMKDKLKGNYNQTVEEVFADMLNEWINYE